MVIAIIVIINILLAAMVAKKVWSKFFLGKKNIFGSSFFIIIFSAAVGLFAPIFFFGLVEGLGLVVWNEPGRLLGKMIGYGFWSSMFGSYLGLREAKKSLVTKFELGQSSNEIVVSDLLSISESGNLSNQSKRQKFNILHLSKDSKKWIFWSLFWATAVLLYTLGLDPFNNGSWDYMDSDEYSTLFFVMFVPPLFLFISKKIYGKFIK